jgi:hypothetical protein
MVDKVQIYDWLLEKGVGEPAVLKLGDRCVIGRWVSTGLLVGSTNKVVSTKEDGYGRRIVSAGPKAIEVIVEASTWDDAWKLVVERLGS